MHVCQAVDHDVTNLVEVQTDLSNQAVNFGFDVDFVLDEYTSENFDFEHFMGFLIENQKVESIQSVLQYLLFQNNQGYLSGDVNDNPSSSTQLVVPNNLPNKAQMQNYYDLLQRLNTQNNEPDILNTEDNEFGSHLTPENRADYWLNGTDDHLTYLEQLYNIQQKMWPSIQLFIVAAIAMYSFYKKKTDRLRKKIEKEQQEAENQKRLEEENYKTKLAEQQVAELQEKLKKSEEEENKKLLEEQKRLKQQQEQKTREEQKFAELEERLKKQEENAREEIQQLTKENENLKSQTPILGPNTNQPTLNDNMSETGQMLRNVFDAQSYSVKKIARKRSESENVEVTPHQFNQNQGSSQNRRQGEQIIEIDFTDLKSDQLQDNNNDPSMNASDATPQLVSQDQDCQITESADTDLNQWSCYPNQAYLDAKQKPQEYEDVHYGKPQPQDDAQLGKALNACDILACQSSDYCDSNSQIVTFKGAKDQSSSLSRSCSDELSTQDLKNKFQRRISNQFSKNDAKAFSQKVDKHTEKQFNKQFSGKLSEDNLLRSGVKMLDNGQMLVTKQFLVEEADKEIKEQLEDKGIDEIVMDHKASEVHLFMSELGVDKLPTITHRNGPTTTSASSSQKDSYSISEESKNNSSSSYSSYSQKIITQGPAHLSIRPKSQKLNEKFHEFLEPGRFQSKFINEQELGKGGFGIVFKARHKIEKELYAVKKVRLHLKAEDDLSQHKTYREVTALLKFNSPHIIRYYTSWFEPLSEEDITEENKIIEIINKKMAKKLQKKKKKNLEVIKESMEDEEKVEKLESSSDNATHSFNTGKVEEVQDNDDDYEYEYYDEEDAEDEKVQEIQSENIDGSEKQSKSNEQSQKNSNNNSSEVGSQTIDSLQSGTQNTLKSGSQTKSVNNSSSIQYQEDDEESSSEDEDDCTSCSGFSVTIKNTLRQLVYDQKDYISVNLMIQTEYCPGNTLDNFIDNRDRNNIDRNKDFDIFSQLVDGVITMHDSNFVHRDLKPKNVFFDENSKVKIGDFGLAKSIIFEELPRQELESTEASSTSSEQQLNIPPKLAKSNSLTGKVGTLRYMAPEIQKEQTSLTQNDMESEQKKDIYALGIMLADIICNPQTYFEMIGKIDPYIKEQGKLPPGYDLEDLVEGELLLKMTHQDPNERPTAQQIKQEWLPKWAQQLKTNENQQQQKQQS